MTFTDFYKDHYVPRHSQLLCRGLHLVGMVASFCLAGVALWLQDWWLIPLIPVPTFLFGWLGHFTAGNRPTFLEHPMWSVMAFGKMVGGIFGLNKAPAEMPQPSHAIS